MDTLTRRRFLIASGVSGGAALAAGSGLVTWRQLHQAAAERPLAAGTGVVVVVTLYGGNDGINTLVPYGDPAYHRARPELAYDEKDVLHLDDTLGLNPSMKGMAALWQQKKLAVVRGVGYPKPDHSHFRSMDIWQTASPDTPVNTGWLGRWLDHTGDDPLRAVNIGTVLPPLAVGQRTTMACLDPGREKKLPADVQKAFAGLARTDPADGTAMQQVVESYAAGRAADAAFTKVVDTSTPDDDDHESAAGEAGGQANLKQQLDLVARCIKAGVPTRAYSVSLGGFDTHADEKGTQQTQIGLVDDAVSGFVQDVSGDPHGSGVAVLVYSEFGRRVMANASQGTDHGTAGPVFLAGPAIRGGFYGDEPSLTDLDDGDLKVTTDFRAVYGELLGKVLGSDPAAVLGSDRPTLGFVA